MNRDFRRFLRFYTGNPFSGYGPFEIKDPYKFLCGNRPKTRYLEDAMEESGPKIKRSIEKAIRRLF